MFAVHKSNPAMLMEKELIKSEYSSLRDEILKWQEKRITFTQMAITLVTAYTGFMLSIKREEVTGLSWQTVSIFPLLILAITMHINKTFELLQLRAGAFLAVYHDSVWENSVGKISFSKGLRIGYNKSMASFILLLRYHQQWFPISKYPAGFFSWETIGFLIIFIIFFSVFYVLFNYDTKKERQKLIDQWQNLKDGNEPEEVNAMSLTDWLKNITLTLFKKLKW